MNTGHIDNMTAIQRDKSELLREIADITRVLSDCIDTGDTDRIHALLDDRERRIEEARAFDAAYEAEHAQLDDNARELVDRTRVAAFRAQAEQIPPELAAFFEVMAEQRDILVAMKKVEDDNLAKTRGLVEEVKKQLRGIQKNRDVTDRYMGDFLPEPGTLFDKKE